VTTGKKLPIARIRQRWSCFAAIGQTIRIQLRQRPGIPGYAGSGPTKTLAKIQGAEANCRKPGPTERRGAITLYVKKKRFGWWTVMTQRGAGSAPRSIQVKRRGSHGSPVRHPLAAAGVVHGFLPTGVQSEGVLEKQAEVTHKIGVQHCGYLPCILLKWLFIN
jgi:hypothetical protein